MSTFDLGVKLFEAHKPLAESHIFCFQGYGSVPGPANPNPIACGGPENSLTLWNDEGDNAGNGQAGDEAAPRPEARRDQPAGHDHG